MEKRAHIIFSGIVQGVGFRWAAEDVASSLGLRGWVRNQADGTVEAVSEGRKEMIELFIERMKKEMSRYVRSTKVTWEEATGEYSSFEIRF